ncbi:type IV secretory pathway TrbL component [Nocardia sp. GAS34]|uniref:hypothetical protein n=1 Tax=unclassified Nocardia TaxID=2637762 RepID=UPI003D1A9550
MKQLSVTVARGAMIVALGAMATGLAACGGGKDNAANAASGASTTSATASAAATTAASGSATASAGTTAPTTTTKSTLGPASQTLCSTFRNMDIDTEKSVVEKALAENPGSKFQGSPDVALGTAKLVCLAHSVQNEPLAVAIGIAQK